jgi:hypothetical protein
MMKKNIQQQIDLLRKLGTKAPAAAGTETHLGSRLSRYFRYFRADLASPVARMVIGVPWRLRYPRQLTVLAIAAAEAPNAVYNVLRAARAARAARAVQRRGPRIAAGLALLAAGSVAWLGATAAEPLR